LSLEELDLRSVQMQEKRVMLMGFWWLYLKRSTWWRDIWGRMKQIMGVVCMFFTTQTLYLPNSLRNKRVLSQDSKTKAPDCRLYWNKDPFLRHAESKVWSFVKSLLPPYKHWALETNYTDGLDVSTQSSCYMGLVWFYEPTIGWK
jgi:hypothetical protein